VAGCVDHATTDDKLAGYFRVPSIQHYLIFSTRRPEVIHHRRAGEAIETRVVAATLRRLFSRPSMCLRSATTAASIAIGSTARRSSRAIAASIRSPRDVKHRGRPSIRLGSASPSPA